MEELEKKLKAIKELLKGMNNAGLGGTGSVKSGAVLPSLPKTPKVGGNNSLAGKVKIPGMAAPSKVNPVKSAEQTHNKDIKDIRMKEAQAQLSMKKDEGAPRSANISPHYHIHQGSMRITSRPLPLKEINEKHGGIKNLEAAGYRATEVKPEQMTIKKNGQWELD